MNIRVFSAYGDLVEEFTERYGNHGFVNDDSYTHAIILNNYIPDQLLTKPEHTIGIAMEPIEFLGLTQTFVDYARKSIGKYFIGEYAFKFGYPFVNKRFFCTYMSYPAFIPKKDRIMSIAFSTKQMAPGHKYRHELVKAILKTDLPIDIYGHGCELYRGDSRLKGSFESDLTVHGPYKYHIAIENYQRRWYYTEKIINPLQCGTVPLYYGCPNITDVFPSIPIITLTGNINEDMCTIKALCDSQPNIPFDRSKIRGHISFDQIIEELTSHS
jgi:hypothetical protein